MAQFAPLSSLSRATDVVCPLHGEVGVFDRLMLAFVHAAVSAPALVAALMLYSLVYYIPAYVIGSAMFAACEARVRWRRASAVTKASVRIVAWTRVVARSVVRLAPEATPLVVGVATSAGGLVLLVSGATPPVTSRVEWLADVLPLGVIEMSHFAASMTGVVLMLLGWALTRRLAAAYAAAIVMTALGIAASLLKGLDWEEAASLGIALLLLAANRAAFHRRSALSHAFRSWSGKVAALGGVASMVWLVPFASRHLEFSHQLWWRFMLNGEAPGALRAAVGGVAATMAMSVTQLLRSRSATPAPPTDDELARAARLVCASPDVAAAIALLGDKRLLFAPHDRAFLMYGVQGDSWIALGDPVGEAAAAIEVAWRFREHAHRAGARPAFYQVSAEQLPLLIDLGMSVHKIGESASRFTLTSNFTSLPSDLRLHSDF